MGLILQSCLGGLARDFKVEHLSGMMFRFSVASKDVGFLVYHLRSQVCKSFDIFFHLWGNGGPNWIKDYKFRLQQQNDQWNYVHKKSRKPSYVDVLRAGMDPSPPTSNRSVSKRLSFPSNSYQQNYAKRSAYVSRKSREQGSSYSSASPERYFRGQNPNLNSRLSSNGSVSQMRCFRCRSPNHHVASCQNMVR